VEAKARKTGVAKTEIRRSKKGKRIPQVD